MPGSQYSPLQFPDALASAKESAESAKMCMAQKSYGGQPETCLQHGENWEADLIARAKEADDEEESHETDISAPGKVSPAETSEHLEKLKFCSTE